MTDQDNQEAFQQVQLYSNLVSDAIELTVITVTVVCMAIQQCRQE